MRDHDKMMRAGLISPIRERAGNPKGAPRRRRGGAVRFLTFGEHELREFNRSVLPMRIFDRETLRYLAANDAAVKLYGYSREEFLALTLKDTRHPEEHGEIRPTLAEPTGYLRHWGPRRHVKKSGEILVVELLSQDIVFNGRKARLSAVVDVTEPKRAQEELSRQKKVLDAIINHLPVGVFIKDAKTFRYVMRNRFNRAVFGSLADDYVGKSAHELFPKETADKFIETDREAVETRQMVEVHEQEVIGRSGDVRIQHVRKVPLFDANGEPWLIVGISDDITGRKCAEQALRESNEFLRSMIESSRDCIKVLDLDGRLLSMNSGGQRQLEIADLTPLLNTSWVDFWRGADREAACNAVAAAAAGNTGTFEGCCPTRTGVPKWWDVIVTPILDPAGKPETLLAVSRDITERKVVERALHESESKYRNLVESSSDLIWSADVSGRLTFINLAVRRIYGYEPEEMLGKPVAALLGDGHWKKPFAFFRKMLAEDRSVADYECEVRSKNGERVILSSNAIVMRDAEGKRIGVSGVSKDITARKRMEGELRQSEERFRQLAENIREVFWIATLNHDKVVYISPAYEEIWGRSRHLLYRDPLDWMRSVHPDDLPAVRKGIENVARGVSLNAEYRVIHPDGTLRWIRDRSYQMKAGDGTPLACGIAEDITDSKRAEQERLTHALRQRDALVREVHHRIKNSLQGVVGLLRQKIRKYPASAPGIEEAITQLQSVATVYGLQGRELERNVSLAEILDAICTSAESLTGGNVVRDFDVDNGHGTQVDEAEAVPLAVALNELVFNALKHQPAEAGEKRARVALRETKDTAEICITNRGRLPAGFDFAGGRAVGHGLGLVRTLIALPGGAITFNGGGEQVQVVLKLSPPLLAERERAFAR